MDTIDSHQIRAARGLLNWNQERLADVSEVARASIKNIENDLTVPRIATLRAIKYAFEKYGVEFTPNSGVRLKSKVTTVLEGPNCQKELYERIYQAMKKHGGEVLTAAYREPDPDKEPERYAFELAHVKRMEAAGITTRYLIEEGDTNFIRPWKKYRWIPEEYFSPYPFITYGKQLAMVSMRSPERVVIIHDQLFVESFSKLFEFIWNRAVLPIVDE